MYNGGSTRKKEEPRDRRLALLRFGMGLFLSLVIIKLGVLQIVNYDFYVKAAEGRHSLYKKLWPERGRIYFSDLKSPGDLFPLAINRSVYTIFVDPARIKEPQKTARALAKKLELSEKDVLTKLTETGSRYEIIKKRVSAETADELKLEKLTGVEYEKEFFRFYPEHDMAAQVVGYLGLDEASEPKGFYGLEGYFNELLAGQTGFISTERDAKGGWLTLIPRQMKNSVDGVDMILTLDRVIEAYACQKLKEGVKKHQAKSGSVVIINPKNGAILALCNEPGFDPNNYNEVKDLGVFNNSVIFTAYEPGSVFKAITLAAALDADKVTPETTYIDTGIVKIGPDTIHNAANKVYGEQNMIGVLKESINTGAVFAAQRVGLNLFRKYVQDFGFGVLSNVELDKESGGDIDMLSDKRDIYLATASFGQGITATPLQLAAAFGSIANKGRLYKPYIVSQFNYPDGNKEKVPPQMIRQVIGERSAKILSGMLTVVVREGHGKAAGVPGYYIAGKTGTAQIAGPGGRYIEGATNQTFVGFGPVDDPQFVMVVKYEDPKAMYAEYTAVPTFGEIAKFLLQYLEIPPG
ncbi:MAG: penicillin-binding protein 2 [Patescibacteria group bacterium]